MKGLRINKTLMLEIESELLSGKGTRAVAVEKKIARSTVMLIAQGLHCSQKYRHRDRLKGIRQDVAAG